MEHPFISIGKKKKKEVEMNGAPTNSGGTTNPNNMTEAKKKYGEYSPAEKEGKVLRSASRSLASISGRRVPETWEKNRPLHPDPVVAKALKKKITDRKIDQYKQEYSSFKKGPAVQGKKVFKLHPDTQKALDAAQQKADANKPANLALAKRLKVKGAVKAVVKNQAAKAGQSPVVHYPDTSSLEGGKPKSLKDVYHEFHTTGRINRIEAMAAAQAQHHQDLRAISRASDYRRVQQPHFSDRYHNHQDRVDHDHAHAEYQSHVSKINDIFKSHQKQFNLAKPAIEISSRGYVPDTTPDHITHKPEPKKKGVLGKIKSKLFGEDVQTKRVATIKNIVESFNQFKAPGAGPKRAGGAPKKGTRGARKSPVTMQKTAYKQVAKGVRSAAMSQKQAAAISYTKQRAHGAIQHARAVGQQYRVN